MPPLRVAQVLRHVIWVSPPATSILLTMHKDLRKPDWSDTKSRLFGALATLNYSYQNIYLLDASVRSDGSSEFGSDNKTALFWSFGLGLALHNYEFIKKLSFIDEFKIRGTYGSSGKVNFEPFAAKPFMRLMVMNGMKPEWVPI